MSPPLPILLSASLPTHDWQFWATTAIALVALLWLLRGVLPIPFLKRRKKRGKRVSITVGGKSVK